MLLMLKVGVLTAELGPHKYGMREARKNIVQMAWNWRDGVMYVQTQLFVHMYMCICVCAYVH